MCACVGREGWGIYSQNELLATHIGYAAVYPGMVSVGVVVVVIKLTGCSSDIFENTSKG